MDINIKYALVLVISLSITSCKGQVEDKENTCLIGSTKIEEFESSFSNITFKFFLEGVDSLAERNKLKLYVDTNRCVYVNKFLETNISLFELFSGFVENSSKRSDFPEHPNKATVIVYSNSFGKRDDMERQIDSIRFIYEKALNFVVEKKSRQLFNKNLNTLSYSEREVLEERYNFSFISLPFWREKAPR